MQLLAQLLAAMGGGIVFGRQSRHRLEDAMEVMGAQPRLGRQGGE